MQTSNTTEVQYFHKSNVDRKENITKNKTVIAASLVFGTTSMETKTHGEVEKPKIINNPPMRKIVSIMQKLAEEEDINFSMLNGGWTIVLEKNGETRIIEGYKFLNDSGSSDVCTDKASLASVLTRAKVPCVEHELIFNPTEEDYVSPDGVWQQVMDFAKNYDYKIVVKVKNGTGGENIYQTKNRREIEAAVLKLFTLSTQLTLSPYYDVEEEYRVIVQGGKTKIIFKKERPFITGDGKLSVMELIARYFKEPENEKKWKKIIKQDFAFSSLPYNKILKEGEKFDFQWKHNLGQGAAARLIHHECEINGIYPTSGIIPPFEITPKIPLTEISNDQLVNEKVPSVLTFDDDRLPHLAQSELNFIAEQTEYPLDIKQQVKNTVEKDNLSLSDLLELVKVLKNNARLKDDDRIQQSANRVEQFCKQQELISRLKNIALRATAATNVKVGSVDIIKIKDAPPGDDLRVMEINSGLMMENFIRQHGTLGEALATHVYRCAFREMTAGMS